MSVTLERTQLVRVLPEPCGFHDDAEIDLRLIDFIVESHRAFGDLTLLVHHKHSLALPFPEVRVSNQCLDVVAAQIADAYFAALLFSLNELIDVEMFAVFPDHQPFLGSDLGKDLAILISPTASLVFMVFLVGKCDVRNVTNVIHFSF